MTPSAANLAAAPEAVVEAINDEPTIDGRLKQLTLDVGGHKVTTSEFKLKGGSVAVEGQFQKGERVQLIVEAVVGKIEFQDKADSEGNVIATTRRHVATIDSVQRGGNSDD